VTDRILIIDDEQAVLTYLGRFFAAKGYEVERAADGTSGLASVEAFAPNVVLLDLRLPDCDGLTILEKLKQDNPFIAVIVITGHGDVDTAVSAMRARADHFLLKPVDLEALQVVVQRVLESYRQRDELTFLRHRQLDASTESPGLLLPESLTQAVRSYASGPSTSVLVMGETGTGKGVIARMVHELSPRSARPFVDINCAGLAGPLLESELFGHEQGAFTGAQARKRGLLEIADGGSLFLDEIGEMPLEVQAKLLKVLEEKTFRRVGGTQTIRVDIRLLAATNIDLERASQSGRFRRDLLYRLNVVSLVLPPLRERQDAIIPLARRFVAEFAAAMGKVGVTLTPAAEQILVMYGWPGNVRELRNVVERAVLLCTQATIQPKDLPDTLRPRRRGPAVDLRGDNTLATLEGEHIRRVLEAVAGNRSRAAEILGLHRATLITKIKKLGLS
jgi:two-component system response regulator AtoC